jgi:N-acetylneuraminate synthase/N,N'-diacetyllegionaminate synthase
MLLFNKDTKKEVIVIAEIGVNHMGSLEWILKMLPQVKAAGADAVKFQLFTPDLYSSRSNPERHMQVSKLALSKSDFLQIKKAGDSIDLPVFATPLSHDWVSFIAEVCGVIKIASGDFSFAPTVDTALTTSSKIIISSGATSRDEVKNFVFKAKKMRPGNNYYESIALLHCISSYPPPNDESNLSAIIDLKELTELTVGFSSHFLDDAPLFVALGMGARIFEIHVTDDRTRTDIRDHALSRTTHELKFIIDSIEQLNKSLFSGAKSIQKSEFSLINQLKKGFIYSKNLPSGHTLTLKDINYARPLNSDLLDLKEIIGKKLSKSVGAFTTINIDELER